MTRKERYTKVIEYFREHGPVPETELFYGDPFELIVAVILSAQCTDKRVNMITPKLLKAYPDAASMAKATPEEIFPYIRSCSYPNNKSKHLSGMAKMLSTEFGGVVPSERDELMKLPGVGRKTANVIASVIFSKPVMAVDTHVLRVSRRIGLAPGAKTPLEAEMMLTKNIPGELMHHAHHWLILHGRYVCVARKPHCDKCGIKDYCMFFNSSQEKKNLINLKKH